MTAPPIFPDGSKLYVLDAGHSIRLAESLEDWWGGLRSVAFNTFGHEGIGHIGVSTVFLGIDHRKRLLHGDGPPILFETIILAETNGFEHYQTRCSTWAEALAMHRAAIEHVKNSFRELAIASGA